MNVTSFRKMIRRTHHIFRKSISIINIQGCSCNNLHNFFSFVQFRVALLLGSNATSTTNGNSTAVVGDRSSTTPLRLHDHAFFEPILSRESLVISTLAGDVPFSTPVNVRAAPIAPTSIGLSWQAGPFPNGPLLSYVLHITDDRHEEVINKVAVGLFMGDFIIKYSLFSSTSTQNSQNCVSQMWNKIYIFVGLSRFRSFHILAIFSRCGIR